MNPLDDEKRLAVALKFYEDSFLSQGEKLAYSKRMRIFKISSEQQLTDALKETRDMNRVPLIVRTPKNTLTLSDIKPRVCKGFQMSPEGTVELNLRQVFSESFGNPIKKEEQREVISSLVKQALVTNKLLLLNFDDFEYPQAVLE